jgi:hypothetical protein
VSHLQPCRQQLAPQTRATRGFANYGAVEGWNVFVDNDKKPCLIERVDDAGNVVQMGLTADSKFGYLGVFSKGNTGVKKGAKEEIFLDIDGELFSSASTGMKGNITEGYSGGYILANNQVFIDAVKTKYIMTVFPKEDAMFTVDLHGTYKAMDMARKCNREQN